MSENPVHMEHIAPFEQKVQVKAGLQAALPPARWKNCSVAIDRNHVHFDEPCTVL
jgi:hypothetical protein